MLKTVRITDFDSETDALRGSRLSSHSSETCFSSQSARQTRIRNIRNRVNMESKSLFSPSLKTGGHHRPEIASVSLLLRKKGTVHRECFPCDVIVSSNMTIYGMLMG